MKRFISILCLGIVLSLSCSKVPDPETKGLVAGNVYDVTATTARLTGYLYVDITSGSSFGILLSQEKLLSLPGRQEIFVNTLGVDNMFSVTAEDLEYAKTYYYATFLKTGDIYRISDVKSFVAGAVDMGTGVKWAVMNIGASAPEEYGDYYAWGETETKDSYTDDNYKFTSNPSVLPLANDVANVKLGGKWRMPTEADFKELINNCTSEWTTLNGVTGRKFVSKKNGNSIFLPAADFLEVEYSRSDAGYYWSSSLCMDEPDYYPVLGLLLYITPGNVFTSDYFRSSGLSVRPVSD